MVDTGFPFKGPAEVMHEASDHTHEFTCLLFSRDPAS
jgi:hypothetical protein